MCVDTMQIKTVAGDLRKAISTLQDNPGVDRVGFTLALLENQAVAEVNTEYSTRRLKDSFQKAEA